ncbi:flagellar hook-length control protein FliK [Pseudomonas gingeri]|uniref:flagellar hook-length control protein FliK n=1 Tax=Pseudomonas gingeri TaxID=117681 RepID=UPI00159FE928|nr:flagellar hook-length control protein FliK [Pseudomonas gingeri]NWA00930.1 flagellar hook-length control protein FliK [Pseudomonas gingeri]NWA16026.1 flagellar hook-length control protein FliK [Pseudomonas gingeri]NWA54216.1 flagellar hook-length control protein FliK [Pseudomonas gingeri]NWA97707.1 flagellar hook-length control protein FliK [Pseudomonas gingeri]NWB04513.1 flagellar hook-length control protein FliK [Pseudomonas gingeri]
MPLAPNSLLQATAAAKPKADLASNPPAPVAQPKDNASSFAQVYQSSQNNQSKSVKAADSPVKSTRDTTPAVSAKKDVVASNKGDAAKPAVADSGNSLPADKTTSSDTTTKAGDDQATADDKDKDSASDTPVADATPVDPTLDPALIQAAVTPPAPVPEAPPAVAPAQQPVIEAPLAAAVTAAPVQAAATPPASDSDFDPNSDPLDNLPAVRLAMEQGGHVSTTSQPTTKTTSNNDTDPNQALNQNASVAVLVDQKTDAGTTEQGGEKSFKGLIEDGLKDLKGASSDTRVDDFANRLAALTQAAVPKTANALPVNQPLAMHQSGWTEEVVNRVMYLSSASIKSADIQLEPAELGRLDIKVNMSADQATQISFVSGHAGVRDALESNMFRLRDMLQQQGLGQADVSVSDQSRGWTGQGQDPQQQQQQAQKGSNNGGGGRLDGGDDDIAIAAATEAAATSASVVVGSSAVDYYA